MKNNELKKMHNQYNESLDDKLEFKLNKEYFEFTEGLLRKSKEEILQKSYEITVKEEIKDILLSDELNLHDKEKIILLNTDNVLTEFYHDWLDIDIPLGDALRDTLEESIISVTRYYGKQNKHIQNDNLDMER